VLVAVGLAAIFAGMTSLPRLRAIELRLSDWRLRVIRPNKAINQVLIVGIEDSTFKTLPAWGPGALQRSAYAAVVRRLADYGARAIAVDVYFGQEPDSAKQDAELAAAMKDAGNVVIVADPTVTIERGTEHIQFAPPSSTIAEAATAVASQLLFRPDGIVRSVNLWQTAGDGESIFPALCFAAVQVAKGAPPHVPDSNWPNMLIRWAGPSGTVSHIPLEDVHQGRVEPALVRNRIVFVGRWDEMEDRLQTPLGPMSGVEIHAQAAATMLSGRYAIMPGLGVGFLTAIPLCALLGFMSVGLRAWRAWLLTGLVLLLWILGIYAAYRVWLVLLPMAGTTLALLACGVVLAVLQSERTVSSLSRLWPSWVTAEGEEIEATVLVCDLAGYTSKSEQAAPGEMMALLREFFALVDETMGAFGGVLARRPGDAAIVFFRAEEGLPHHAARAVRAAIALRNRLRDAWRGRDIDFGITLTTGNVSLGFVGVNPPEPQILGDPVNVAFRLQEECRKRKQCILADWPTASADPETANIMRPVGEVTVRHRTSPVQLFVPQDA